MGCACAKKKAPTTMTVAKNAATAAGKAFFAYVRGRKVFSEQELVDKRMAACVKCQYFDKDKVKCRDCGCYLLESFGGIPGKARIATEKCPIYKW